jgi:hypothetical protein
VLVASSVDTIIVPRESSWFGFCALSMAFSLCSVCASPCGREGGWEGRRTSEDVELIGRAPPGVGGRALTGMREEEGSCR